MPGILDLYHRLPYPLKVATASARGYALKSWRYGRDHEFRVDAVLTRDFWDQDRWTAWQRDRLSFVLERAATRVPYYRDYWAAQPASSGSPAWTALENWPLLEIGRAHV